MTNWIEIGASSLITFVATLFIARRSDYWRHSIEQRKVHKEEIVGRVLRPLALQISGYYLPACALKVPLIRIGVEDVVEPSQSVGKSHHQGHRRILELTGVSVERPGWKSDFGLPSLDIRIDNFLFEHARNVHLQSILNEFTTLKTEFQKICSDALIHGKDLEKKLRQDIPIQAYTYTLDGNSRWAKHDELAVFILNFMLGISQSHLDIISNSPGSYILRLQPSHDTMLICGDYSQAEAALAAIDKIKRTHTESTDLPQRLHALDDRWKNLLRRVEERTLNLTLLNACPLA